MAEPNVPAFHPEKYHIGIRDRERANVAFQQDDNFFDRRGNFVAKASFRLIPPDPPKIEVKIKDISHIRQTRGNKSEVKPLSTLTLRSSRLAAALKAPAVPEAVRKAEQENARAANAERLAT